MIVGVKLMIERNDLDKVKKSLQQNIGRKVRLTSKKGRKSAIVRRGVIENIYPSIFTIRLDRAADDTENRRVSFSYTDVLTKTVEIVMYK